MIASATLFLTNATVALTASIVICLRLRMKFSDALQKAITIVIIVVIPLMKFWTTPWRKVMMVCCLIIMRAERKLARITLVMMTKLFAKNW